MHTYEVSEAGYDIFHDSAKIIHQPHSPNKGLDAPLTPLASEQIAKMLVGKLNAGCSPIVTLEEETRLETPATDEEIQALVDACVAAMAEPVV